MSDSKKRVAVFIDGSNLYHYLKETDYPIGTKFRFDKFVDFLVGDNRECVYRNYYTGIFRNLDGTDKSKQLVRGQQKFLAGIENEGFVVKRGRIIYDSAKPREKGTDVKIAIDLVLGAVDDLFDVAIVISSDTDLVPAVRDVVQRDKEVEYVGFAHAPSLGMQKHVTLSILLKQDDLERFKERPLI